MSRFPTQQTKACVIDAHGGLCAYCLTGRATTVDHVRPKCRGGRDGISNLVAACDRCNTAKGGRSIVEWVTAMAEVQAAELVAAGYPAGRRRERARVAVLRIRNAVRGRGQRRLPGQHLLDDRMPAAS